MRLLRVGDSGSAVPVVLAQAGQARDLRPVTSEIDGDFLAGGGLSRLRHALADLPALDSPQDAAAVIAGYAISNDVSERDFQHKRGGQWQGVDLWRRCRQTRGRSVRPGGRWACREDAKIVGRVVESSGT
ncbi:fumarylacetoacetate hydrolase family protein [Amycolatopsis sp. NPDC051045]|uniref:fumarylacetoacetate hydrolase family protein n=1 Tax=Amycolatopsis sp. NPDC051045 TaxID=3156922 RepID=UPI0034288C7E